MLMFEWVMARLPARRSRKAFPLEASRDLDRRIPVGGRQDRVRRRGKPSWRKETMFLGLVVVTIGIAACGPKGDAPYRRPTPVTSTILPTLYPPTNG
jgi:hypothetical protein